MKALGLTVLGILATAGAVAIVVLVSARLDSHTATFLTYDALKASGLVERGWVPIGLPPSTRHIEESHDVSANSGSATFEYDPVDTQLTRQNCKTVIENAAGSKFLCPPFEKQAFVVVLAKSGKGTWVLISDAI